ncbi:response regulator [Azospirillum thermophilum]|uniref:Response regulator n=1 Tax=Azospirillum thermophilum TaxID=2202148 RepID=A0A2S2CN71_9PROT|nr:response regulator [Azospirillum thermophilum]AWK85974.1 response regulator [Azospirillum thermophilum]
MVVHDQHILIVDDEAMVLMSLADVLRSAGYRVSMAHDGLEAWAVYQNESVDLLITDMQMPHMGGYDLIQSVRAIRPDQPVIAMTAYCNMLPREEPGRLAILWKPFSSAKLFTFVGNLLNVQSAA